MKIITSKAGELTVLKTWSAVKSNQMKILCLVRCHCDTIFETRLASIKSGRTNSCGCYRIGRTHKHGYHKTRTYFAWNGIKNAHTNKIHPRYHGLAERGIKLCEEWLDFENFLRDMGEKPPGFRMKRLDKGRGFEPGNCEWTPIKQLIHLAKSQNQ